MNVYLASTSSRKEPYVFKSKYILESFFSFKDWQKPMIKNSKFILDSGAFTFMNSKNKKVDLNKYLDEYIDFIIENDVDNFFELDVDIVMGLDWVEKARKKIEERTGKKVIPVWHKQRGIQYFEEMCRNYSYVAIGGIVTGEIKKKEYPAFKKLIRIAHENGAKIHGLGFTSTQELHKYHFDSVDSTSWISGGRFGQMQIFKDGKIKIEKPQNKRAKYKEIDEFNFNQWIKFQDYADVKL